MVVLLLVPAGATGSHEDTVALYYFWGTGCPHCAKAKPFVATLAIRHPGLRVRDYEVFNNRENLALLQRMSRDLGQEVGGVPVFILGDRLFSGFSGDIARQLEELVSRSSGNGREPPAPGTAGATTITVPFVGQVDAGAFSLPVFTIIVAGLDSFNPCAFFVLFFLLSLLTHVHSRPRMLIIGGIFVFFSGFVYFLFMAAWLNLFMLVGHLPAITLGAGVVAVVIAAINIKDYFRFEQGVSLAIPEEAKPHLFERMRGVVRAGSLPAMAFSTVVLAVVANAYELLCTAGFPMVYTRVLTLQGLAPPGYYLYLALYNTVYVVPLAVIVGFFAVTLGSRKLSEWQGRLLKLVSGNMMLCLGVILLIRPELLNNALVSGSILVGVLVATWLIVVICRRWQPEWFSSGNDGG
jgi:thiol-disulfide isomerase/thioredoxin